MKIALPVRDDHVGMATSSEPFFGKCKRNVEQIIASDIPGQSAIWAVNSRRISRSICSSHSYMGLKIWASLTHSTLPFRIQ